MENKLKIILSVFDQNLEEGISGLSIREIGKASGLSIGTLYHHFRDKDDLLKEVINYALSNRLAAVQAGESPAEKTPARMERYWMNLYHHFVNFPGEVIFLSQFVQSSFAERSDFYIEPVIKTIEKGIAQGELRYMYPKLMHEIFLHHVEACALSHHSGQVKIGETQLSFIYQSCWDSIRPK